jgi:hypothetical protein
LPHAKFRVSSVRDLHERVVPFLEGYRLFGRKREAFEIFKPLVALEGLVQAKALAEQLAVHNQRGGASPDRATGGTAEVPQP